MASSGVSAFQFLISTLFGMYAFVVMLRFLMQMTRADYYNPISQFVVKITDPLLVPLRRFIPGFGGQDIAALVLCYLVLVAMHALIILLGYGNASGIWPIVFWRAFVGLLNVVFDVFIYSILGLVILSWISPGGHPITPLLRSITAPIMRPVQRLVPPIGGMDLSPMFALIFLYFCRILFLQPLMG